MPNVCARLLIVPLVLVLASCGSAPLTIDVGPILGDDAAEEGGAGSTAVEPVQSVGTVEVGRTSRGILITAIGTAPGLGYSQPTLRARREGKLAADGYLDFDFVAKPPAPGFNLPPGTTRTRSIRADLPVSIRELRGVRGLRVHALRGAYQVDF